MKKIFIVLLFVSLVVAEEINVNEKTKKVTGISARKRLGLGLGGGHLWIAGLHALGIFAAIKLKLVIITAIIGFGIFYGFKIWAGSKLLGGGCATPEIIHDSPYSPYEHTPYHAGAEYSSYPGPPDHGSYSSFPGLEHSFSGPEHSFSGPDHSPYSGSFDSGLYKDAGAATDITPIEPYRRQRSFNTERKGNEWSDLAFTFLGLNSKECRKRFICEMDFRVASNPMLELAYNYISRGYLREYRDNDNEKPTNINDCVELYSKCTSFESTSDNNKEEENSNNGRSTNYETTTKIEEKLKPT